MKELLKRKVVQTDLEGKFIKEYEDVKDASTAIFGDTKRAGIIAMVCCGARPSCKGFKFKYADE